MKRRNKEVPTIHHEMRNDIVESKTPSSSSPSSGGPASEPVNNEPLWRRIGAALFYGMASLAIMLINKQVLTVYHFKSPLFLGLGQMTCSIVIITVLKKLRKVDFPDYSNDIISRIFPLPLFYLANMLFGLASTQELSLPMLTVLRRFSILFTMILSYYYLNQKQRKFIQFSVFLMIFGAVVAAADDLSFNMKGYVFILLNDIATAGQGVVTKSKLNSRDLGKFGLIYYNSLFMFIPTLMINYFNGDIHTAMEFEQWHNAWFVVNFSLSCIFGFVLMYATTLCTQINSALDTTIIGCLKNIIVTYVGMVFGGDYIFSLFNFAGLNISIVGSLLYTKASLSKSKSSTSNTSTTSSSSLKSVTTT